MLKLLRNHWPIAVTFALCLFYYFGASATADTRVSYHLTLDPEQGLVQVEMVLTNPKRLMVGLYLHKTGNRVNNLRITDLEGNKKLHWPTVPGARDARRIWLGPGGGPVRITYSIDPNLILYGRQVGLIEPDFARFRGLDTLYAPFGLSNYFTRLRGLSALGDDCGQAVVTWTLPPDWQAFGPWSVEGEIPLSSLTNSILVAGEIEVVAQEMGSKSVKVGFYQVPAHPLTLNFLEEIIQQALVITGQEPASYAPHFSIIIGPGLVGNSGPNSVVAYAHKEVLAHEIFHWWIGQTIDAQREALWFKEGFTTYYTHRLLVDTGHSTSLEQALATYERALGLPQKLNLSRASRHHNVQVFYYGGAILAHHLDLKLKEESNNTASLDGFLQHLLRKGAPVNNRYFVRELRNFGYPQIADWFWAVLHGREELPGMGK